MAGLMTPRNLVTHQALPWPTRLSCIILPLFEAVTLTIGPVSCSEILLLQLWPDFYHIPPST